MTLGRKDVAATGLTALVVLVFAASYEGWNVWLVGGSHRWAAGVILLLGIGTCGLGTPSRGVLTVILATLGTLALVLGALALVTGSLTALSLLVVDIVVLWTISTFRHGLHTPSTPVPA